MARIITLNYSAQVEPEFEERLLQLSVKLGIERLFLLTKSVKRFVKKNDPYPEGMISDNVYDHLCRSAYILSQIFEGDDLEYALSLLLVHDLPEIYLGDKSIVEKQLDDEDKEKNIAYHIFKDSPYAYDLYQSFTQGADFANGELWKYTDDLRIPIIVKMVDRAEGNSYFHLNLYEWLKAGNTALPDYFSLRFMFENNQKIMSGIAKESRGTPKELQNISRNILLMPERLVEQLYDGKENIIPDEFHEYTIQV